MRTTRRKPLHLNRETLRNLTSAQDLRAVRGGGNATLTCTTCLAAGCNCVNTPPPGTVNASCLCPYNRD